MNLKRLQIKDNALFSNWPVILYDNMPIQKLTVKIMFPAFIKKHSSAFFNYTIKDDEMRPDIVARRLYNDPKLDWVILFFNQIIDPHFEWPMQNAAFEKYIIDKYDSLSAAQSTVLHYRMVENQDDITVSAYTALSSAAQKYWVRVEDASGNIIRYSFKDDSYEISEEGFDALPASEQVYWDEITEYDREVRLNNERRVIRILRKDVVPLFLSEYRKTLNA